MKKSITKQQLKKMESLSKNAFETSRELNQLSAELSSIVRENYILLYK